MPPPNGFGEDIPVPIEELIDLVYRIDVIEHEGLEQNFQIVALLSHDLKSIRVDKYVYRKQPYRLRFSLAHEVGHLLLHEDVYKAMKFDNVEQYIQALLEIPDEVYDSMEWQANKFAALLLVPRNPLLNCSNGIRRQMEETNFPTEKLSDVALERVLGIMKQHFDVSGGTVQGRLRDEHIWPF